MATVTLLIPPPLPLATPVVKMDPVTFTPEMTTMELSYEDKLISMTYLNSLFDLPELELSLECNPYPKPPVGTTRPVDGQMWPRGVV